MSCWLGWWGVDGGRLPPLAGFVLHGPLYALLSITALGGILVGLRHADPRLSCLSTAMLAFPWTYYVTIVSPRYRHAIEPILVMLSVWFLWQRARPGRLESASTVGCRRT